MPPMARPVLVEDDEPPLEDVVPNPWVFQRVGLGYKVESESIETEIRLTRVKRSGESLTGELVVTTRLAGVKTVNGNVMHVARLNVLSSTSRVALANYLEKRTPDKHMDWHHGIETLAQGVILGEQRGEVIEEVGLDPITPTDEQFAVEPLVMRGRPALLYGPGGGGKSLVALTTGISIATGREIIPGILPRTMGNVLYLDWETNRETVNDRIQAIANGHGFAAPRMFYRRCVRPLADDAEELSAIVAEKDIIYVIVDSAAYAMGAQREYGDANESVLRMHEGLRMMKVTALIIDHVAKSDIHVKPGEATPYGSAYKINAVRTSWELRSQSDEEGLVVGLYHAKSNDTAKLNAIGIGLDWRPGRITFTEAELPLGDGYQEEEQPRHMPLGQCPTDIMGLFGQDGIRLDFNRIKMLLQGSHAPNTVSKTLSRLVKSGRLLIDDDRCYSKPLWDGR